MGSGSSKGPSSRRGGGGGLTGGPSGQHQHQGQGPVGSIGTRPSPPSSPGLTAPPSILQAAAPRPPPPSPPPDPDLELLEQVLEECGDEEEDDVLQKLRLSPPGGHFAPSPPSPPTPPLRLDAGDLGSWRPPQDGVGGGGAEGTRPQEKKQELPQKAARATPESNIFANQAPPKDPDRLAKTSYDYSEEELMATIEQEYCR